MRGEAACIVSAGNTGALMAIAKFVLKTLPGIDRPAIATFFPTLRGESVILDLGANLQCDGDNLVQFAVMGNVFARTVLGFATPPWASSMSGRRSRRATRPTRGGGVLRDTALPSSFHGFVEGDDIAAGTVDVFVTDGFTGNVALKAAEGTVKLYTEFLKQAFKSSRRPARLSLGAPRAREPAHRMDPRRYNGAIFLGLNGIVVKSHGGTDAVGFANAIGVAADMLVHGFHERSRTISSASQDPDEPAIPGRDALMVMRRAVLGCGATCRHVVTNAELADGRHLRRLDRTRTGIRQRCIAAEGELTSDLARNAAQAALARAGGAAGEIDLIVLATSTPDETFPSTATRVQAGLGMKRGAAFDVQAVCRASSMRWRSPTTSSAGPGRTALVIGAETFAHPRLEGPQHLRAVRRRRRRRGAARGAGERQHADRGILSTHLFSDGRHYDLLYVDGGPRRPAPPGHLRMQGREVFRHAVLGWPRPWTPRWSNGYRRQGRRLAGAAPGQPPHHRQDGREAAFAARAGRGDRRPSCRTPPRRRSRWRWPRRPPTAESSRAISC